MFKPSNFLLLVFGMAVLSFSSSWAGEPASGPEERLETQIAEEQQKSELAEKQERDRLREKVHRLRRRLYQIRGARLWPSYCGNCHNLRGPAQYAPGQWDLIMMHMRARANLPPQAAEAILEFLKRR